MSRISTGLVAGIASLICAGAVTAADLDGDGVKDRKDRCANSPISAKVDRHGCPVDSDGDGVFDGIDQCGVTPTGWPVDRDGCARDSDEDGVPDGEDACSGTPAMAIVGSRGCPSDGDGDGVLDGLDRCPATPARASIDGYGCSIDTDHDGVANGIDQCPETAHAVDVDASGCDARPKATLFPDGEGKVVLGGVTFETGEARIDSESALQLNQVVRYLDDYPDVSIEVRAYTDSSGAAWFNEELSERRARVVKAFLEAKGIAPSRISAKGMGEATPIADNRDPEQRSRNRRIEVVRLDAVEDDGGSSPETEAPSGG